MGKSNETLNRIAKLIDKDPDQARKFCEEVQSLCRVKPPFLLIAEAIEHRGAERLSVRSVAELASKLHGRGAGNVLPDEESLTPAPGASSIVEVVSDDEAIWSEVRSLVESVARRTLDQIAIGSIEGKSIGFTGSGPYLQEDLENLATRLGAVPDRGEIGWGELDWMVIGRTDFDWDYLEDSIYVSGIRYYSREEFLGLVLFGEGAIAEGRIDSEASSHQGIDSIKCWLRQIEEEPHEEHPVEIVPSDGRAAGEVTGSVPIVEEPGILFASPSLDGEGSDEPFEDYGGLADISILRRLGYTVARGVSILQRQAALELGVKVLGLRKVVSHVAFLIQMNRNNPRRHSAVSNWRYDFNWLKSRYGAR